MKHPNEPQTSKQASSEAETQLTLQELRQRVYEAVLISKRPSHAKTPKEDTDRIIALFTQALTSLKKGQEMSSLDYEEEIEAAAEWAEEKETKNPLRELAEKAFELGRQETVEPGELEHLVISTATSLKSEMEALKTFETRGSTQNPDNPNYLTKKSKYRNQAISECQRVLDGMMK